MSDLNVHDWRKDHGTSEVSSPAFGTNSLVKRATGILKPPSLTALIFESIVFSSSKLRRQLITKEVMQDVELVKCVDADRLGFIVTWYLLPNRKPTHYDH